ncbi:MAG: hypothetical protein ACI835_005990 [Planctomycetota bacterium]|jgi:hypothetical protein
MDGVLGGWQPSSKLAQECAVTHLMQHTRGWALDTWHTCGAQRLHSFSGREPWDTYVLTLGVRLFLEQRIVRAYPFISHAAGGPLDMPLQLCFRNIGPRVRELELSQQVEVPKDARSVVAYQIRQV